MEYLNSFLIAGIVCAFGQIILDNTKLSPGHITTLFTVIGSFLGFFGIYEKILNTCGQGASILISNFGNSLYQGGITGYKENGFIGIFTGLLQNSSAIITCAIITAFILSIFFKPKN